MITGNEPLYPAKVKMTDADTYNDFQVDNGNIFLTTGLTIRQHFAAKNMSFLVGEIGYERIVKEVVGNTALAMAAKASVMAADALIAELNKPTT